MVEPTAAFTYCLNKARVSPSLSPVQSLYACLLPVCFTLYEYLYVNSMQVYYVYCCVHKKICHQ